MVTGTRKSARDVTSTALVSNNNQNNNATASSSSSALSIQPNKVTTKNVPAFLNKLYLMVDDQKSNELIKWSEDGESFIVPFEQRFGKEMLPRYFKHSNFGSFVRQLNMYGFHKVPHIQQGVLHSEPSDASELLEFANANFVRGQPDLLHLIRRQKARSDAPEHRDEKALDLPSLLTDLSAIRKHQSALSSDLKELQTSNNGLWQEAIQSRERHSRQQETINKILRFLAGVFGGQVVSGDIDGQSPGGSSSVVVEEETTPKESDSNEKGKGKETIPKRKAQLFLTDGPRPDGDEEEIEEIPSARHDATFSNSSQYNSHPTMARSNSYSNYIPTSDSSSRFSTVPSPIPTMNNSSSTNNFSSDFPSIPPDLLTTLLAPGNGDVLNAYLQMQNNNNSNSNNNSNNNNSNSNFNNVGNNNNFNNVGSINPSTSSGMSLPSLPSFSPTNDFMRSLLPSPGPSPLLKNVPNALASLLPTITGGLAPFGAGVEEEDFNQALMENNEVLRDVTLEKADIDQRTSALEEAIKKLMSTLPDETRNQLESGNNTGGSGLGNEFGFGNGDTNGNNAAGGSSGMDWANNDDFLAQYLQNENNSNNVAASSNPNAVSTFSPQDYSFFEQQDPTNFNNSIPPMPINAGNLNNLNNNNNNAVEASSNQFENVPSPSDSVLWKGQNSTSSERSDDDINHFEDLDEDEEDEEDDDDDYSEKKIGGSAKGKGKLKKRKSDALGGGGEESEKKKKAKA